MEESKRPEKMSYEQLENIAHQLSEQNRKLYTDLQKLSDMSFFKRLDLLFKVVDSKAKFSMQFVINCIKEIEELMTINNQEDSIDKDNTDE